VTTLGGARLQLGDVLVELDALIGVIDANGGVPLGRRWEM
jgi:hypothetical protein